MHPSTNIPLHLLELVFRDFPFGVALFQDVQGGVVLKAAAGHPGMPGFVAAEDEVEAQADNDESKDGHEHGKDPPGVPGPVLIGVHG